MAKKKKLKITITSDGWEVKNNKFLITEILGILELIKAECILQHQKDEKNDSFFNASLN